MDFFTFIPGSARYMDVTSGFSAAPADLESLEKSLRTPTQMLLLPLNIPSLNIITIVPKMHSWGVKSTLCLVLSRHRREMDLALKGLVSF